MNNQQVSVVILFQAKPGMEETLKKEMMQLIPPVIAEAQCINVNLHQDPTLKHSRIQSRLARFWGIYMESSGQGGEVYTDVPCRTNKQGRHPDVAYLTPELLTQFGNSDVLPQSFPLIAEIVSPTDIAEDVIAKSQEYLQSGSEEVWLVFPESRWIIVNTHNQRLVFISGEIVSTQNVLQGFSIAVDELLA